jgi:hypothetical protein
MSRSDPTGALLLGTGAGVWIFFKGFRVFREFKIVADTPCMPIRSLPMGLVQVRGQALTDQLIPSPITHTPCCFYQIKIERYETGEHGGWKHHRTAMHGAKFYVQDKTGKVLVDSYSAEYDLPESPPRIVDGAHVAPLMGTGASDQELLQYVQRAGVNQLAGKMEHWLESKGPLDDAKHEQGRQTLLEVARAMSGGANIPWTIPGTLIEKRKRSGKNFYSSCTTPAAYPCRLYQYLSRRLPAATGCVNPLFCPGRSITSPEPAWRTRTHATHMTVT